MKRYYSLTMILTSIICSYFENNGLSQPIQSGLEYGRDIRQSKMDPLLNRIRTMNPNQLETIVPGYEGTQMPEKDYFTSGQSLENEAESKLPTNQTAQFLNQGKANRPSFLIDRDNDPLFKRYDTQINMAHSLTNTYSDCQEIPVGTADATRYRQKRCEINGRRDTIHYSCTKTLSISCLNGNAGLSNPLSIHDFTLSGASLNKEDQSTHQFRFSNYDRHGNCRFFDSTVTFFLNDTSHITEFKFTTIKYDDWLDIEVNGRLVFRGRGGTQGLDIGNSFGCEHGRSWYGPTTDARAHLKTGTNTIRILNRVDGGGRVDISLKAVRRHGCSPQSQFSRSCSNGQSHTEGTLEETSCTKGPQTKMINGFPFFKNCWEWLEDYSKLTPPIYTGQELCHQLVTEGCGQISTTCVEAGDDYCKKEQRSYSCPYVGAAKHITMCGDDFICPEGNCTNYCNGNNCVDLKSFGRKDGTNDFKKSASGLAIGNEIASQLDEESMIAFSGESLECKKYLIDGVINCCDHDGFLKKIDQFIAICSSNEVKLARAANEQRTVYLGTYSKGRLLWKTYHKVYCVFPTKLSRIILEKTKPLLGIDFGSKRHPNCTGLSATQLENINFDDIEFTEIEDDLVEDAPGSTPDPNETIEDISSELLHLDR